MNVKLLLLINLFMVHSIYAETVYKTRDVDGNIIFSDVQTDGAETIEIQEPQTINIPKANLDEFIEATKLTPKEIEYNQFEIISPVYDSTIRDNEGKVSINVEMNPGLAEKHRIVFFMDGKKVSTGRSQQLLLTDVDRGSHSVEASIMNENEDILKSSTKIVFHLRKHSKLFINRSNAAADASDNSSVNTQPIENNATTSPSPSL